MNVLVIGGSGQLGTEIRRRWPATVAAPAHSALALGDAGALDAAIDSTNAAAVINCAAFHNVDTCEREPQRAFDANAVAVDRFAAVCRAKDVRFVTVSTDYVFDGEAREPYLESAAPRPLQVYGVTKFAGELLAGRYSGVTIVRTCGVFGRRPSATKGYTFVDRVITQAKAGEPLRIVDDVIASPTYAGHLAEAMWQVLTRGEPGIYHIANRGPVSWYDFAAEALRQAGIDHPIEAISSGDWKAGARRPKYSALASEKLGSFGIATPDWREGIAAYLQEREQTD